MGISINGGTDVGMGGGRAAEVEEVTTSDGRTILVPRQYTATNTSASPWGQMTRPSIVSAAGGLPTTMSLQPRPDGSVMLAPDFDDKPKPDNVKKPPKNVMDLFMSDWSEKQEKMGGKFDPSKTNQLAKRDEEKGRLRARAGDAVFRDVAFKHGAQPSASVYDSAQRGPAYWGEGRDQVMNAFRGVGERYGAPQQAQPTPFSDVREGVLAEADINRAMENVRARQAQAAAAQSDYIDPAQMAAYRNSILNPR